MHDDDDDLDRLSDGELHALVVKQFLELFADPMFCAMVAPRLTCGEADVIASMVAIHGGTDAARMWMDCHADGDDEPDDEHHIPAVPDDVGGLVS
jgi:hypothetical protein